jgi:phosphoglycolate phosphatase-like HAD superfamily hydrolase
MPLFVSRIRAICFDLDDTLSDTDDQMVAQFVKFLRPVNFLLRKQPLPFVAQRMVMTLESPAHILMGVPDFLGLDEPAAWLFSGINRAIWRRRRNNFLLVSGVREMLQSLSQHYPLAVVSARDAISTRAFLGQYDLLPFFKCIVTAQTCFHTKPFPDPILWAARQMNVPPEACLMVSDTSVDMCAGRAAGAQKVGVLCGFGERAELQKYGADLILTTTPELTLVLEV